MFGKRKASSRIVGFGAALLLVCTTLSAQTFSFRGDRMETVLAKGRERTLLTGNAEVQTEENLIRADRLELYGEEFRYLSCRGNVQVSNDQKGIELTCDELYYNRKEKFIRVNGRVVMLDKKNEVVVKGGFLETWEDSDESVVQVGVRILKKDLVCRAEFARYLRSDEKLELSGMPVVNWKGDEYRALKIYIDLASDTIRLEGAIRGRVTSEQQEDSKDRAAGEAGP